MRKINKAEPDFFTKYIKKQKPKNWEDIKEKSFSFEVREYQLINEQNFQCAYTEILIDDASEQYCHVEHFKKRDLFPKETFNWNNLFTCCNSEKYGAKYKDNSSKIRQEDYQYLVRQMKIAKICLNMIPMVKFLRKMEILKQRKQ